MGVPTSDSISDCTKFSTRFQSLKLLVQPPLVMHNILLKSLMVFLSQVSLIWHLIFIFFLPYHSYLSFFLSCSHFIFSLFYTYIHLLPSFLHPPFCPIVFYPPASLISFSLFCSFCGFPLATITIFLFDIQLYFSHLP